MMVIYDKSTIRVITDVIVNNDATAKLPVTVYLNKRVLHASGLYKPSKLKKVDGEVIPTPRGYARRYYCPVCGRPMWCTDEDTKQPLMTCRRCVSTEVALLYGGRYSDLIVPVWVELMSQNYDPLCKGTATLDTGVCDEWKDPVAFARWIAEILDERVNDTLYGGGKLWLATKCRWRPTHAQVITETPIGYKASIEIRGYDK